MYDDEIRIINEYLKEQLWMNFEMCNMSRGKLELYGYLDEADHDKIKIIFHQSYMVCCNFFFSYEGGEDFISIVNGEEAFQINKRYEVTQGNIIFKIAHTNIETDMFIIARGIEIQMKGYR